MMDHTPETVPPVSRPLSKRAQLLIVAVVTLVLGAALGVGWAGAALFAPPAEAEAKPTPPPAGTFKPTPEQWATLKLAAIQNTPFRSERVTEGKIAINDDRTTPVFSPFSGRVTRLMANRGDTVAQGQPLLALEASEFVQGQNDLIAAGAALNTARTQLKLAEINEKRQRDLYQAKAGALKDWQQSQADLQAAHNTVRSAEIAQAAVRNRLRILGKTEEEVAALEAARKMSAEAFVVAPIAGTVTDRQVGRGQYIQSGASTPVYSIGDLSTVWLVAQVREQDAGHVHLGAAVEVKVLAYPGRVFKAKIAYVAPALDPATRRLAVRAEVENGDRALKPEMFASFSIITGDEIAAPGVPESAVVYEGESARVWVAKPDQTLALRDIRVGRLKDGMVEVVTGLAAGETVVTSGALFIDRAAKGD
jgi:membrane fusion protein, heavy metal efflux system